MPAASKRHRTPRSEKIPRLVYANQKGEIKDCPGLLMAGRSADDFVLPQPEMLIPLPPGSELFVLPERLPVGFSADGKEPMLLDHDPDAANEDIHIQAVAAFISPAHTANLWAAYQQKDESANPLPLFAYTAVGWLKGRFWVCAFRSDPDKRQEPCRYRQEDIRKKTNKKLGEHPANRLVQHLGKCCLTYGCPAAVNYFMARWEAPLPSSPACNARCLGCISLQPSGCCPSTQERLNFVPTPEEIAEVAVGHLRKTGHVVSFGQGCEGEPLMEAETLASAIRLIRKKTDRGRINCNSNASRPEAVARLIEAGLDSIRVSLNSAQEHYHKRYYRPQGFGLSEVKESIRLMKDAGRFVSLNYFILPGFSDDPAELAALSELISQYRPDFIQLRNINIDMDWYLRGIGFVKSGKPMGILQWKKTLRKRFSWLGFGYFNPPGKERG